MDKIDNRITTTYLPTPEEAQRKFERFEKVEKKVEEDRFIRNFALRMLGGALKAPLGAVVAPTNTVGGRMRSVQVLHADGVTKLFTKNKSHKNQRAHIMHELGMITYIAGLGLSALGAVLSGTPMGAILIGIGAGMVSSGYFSRKGKRRK